MIRGKVTKENGQRQAADGKYGHDSDLIEACLAGDESAWVQLVTRYSRLVYSVALRWGCSRDDADDVFQNVFISAYRHLHALRNQKLISAWIISITKRECYRVRQRIPTSVELRESVADAADSLPDQAQDLERQYLVRLALEQLEPRCRDLLWALFLEEPTPKYDQIAARLRMPEGSIGPTRSRCFKKLEEILIEMDQDLNSKGLFGNNVHKK